jgi:hypothetical protein
VFNSGKVRSRFTKIRQNRGGDHIWDYFKRPLGNFFLQKNLVTLVSNQLNSKLKTDSQQADNEIIH